MPLRVLVCTNLYPTEDDPAFGTFVRDEVDALRRSGISIDVLFINGKRSLWNYVWAPMRLWWQLARCRYDVLHAHYGLTGVIARLQWRLPVIVTFHGDEVALGWPARVCRWLSDRIDAAIVTSQRVREDLGAAGAYVIPPGVDLQLFQPGDRRAARLELGLPPDEELVLFVGRATWEKRLDAVQAAVQLLAKERPQAHLLLVSGQPHERIPLYMSAGDVLLLLSGYEGSPMVVKEALACNLPVVASDVGDVAELIGSVEGCALCDGTPEDAARQLAWVLERGQRVAGREAVAHVSLESEAGKVAAVYEQVVAARQAAPAPKEN